MSSPSPSRSTSLAWIAARLREGDDPYGIAASFNAYWKSGGGGSLEEALGLTSPLSRDEVINRRNAWLEMLYDCYSGMDEGDRVQAAHRYWSRYKATKWEDAADEIGGGHPPRSRERICWEILTLIPQIMTARHFRDIVRARKLMETSSS